MTGDNTGRRIRVGKVIGLHPEKVRLYLQLHQHVWPDVVEALRVSNIRNFSIYRHKELLFSYCEYYGDDYEADMARIASDPVSRRWLDLVTPCQRDVEETNGPAEWRLLEEVFHVD